MPATPTICSVCGSQVRVASGEEGTNHYVPVNSVNWISAFEALPKTRVMAAYLVVVNDRVNVLVYDPNDGTWNDFDMNEYQPTHWAELPEPPKA